MVHLGNAPSQPKQLFYRQSRVFNGIVNLEKLPSCAFRSDGATQSHFITEPFDGCNARLYLAASMNLFYIERVHVFKMECSILHLPQSQDIVVITASEVSNASLTALRIGGSVGNRTLILPVKSRI